MFYQLTKHQMGPSQLVTAFNAACEVSVWICLHEEMSISTEIEKKVPPPARPPAPVTAQVYAGWLPATGCSGTSYHSYSSPTRPPSGFSYR